MIRVYWALEMYYIGTQNCPLAYIVCDKAHPDPQRPPLLVNKCYLDKYNSFNLGFFKKEF